MLLWLAEYLTQYYSGFNVFSYLTMRSILSVLTALVLSLFWGPRLIRYLQRMQIGQTVRDDGPQSHLSKSGTPTMGGILILGSIIFSSLMWADLNNKYVLVTLFVVASFGLIGFVDDYRKVIRKDSKGLIARWKYFWQSVVAIGVALLLFYTRQHDAETMLLVPFFKEIMPQLGIMFIAMTYFVIVGTSNAVNLTDGLDGLAIVPTIMVAGALAVFAYVSSNIYFSDYLSFPYLPLASELVIVCTAIVGAGTGFFCGSTPTRRKCLWAMSAHWRSALPLG